MRNRLAATPLVLGALVAGLVLLLAVPGQASAAKPCWERVIDDWLASPNETVTGTYPASCLLRALKYGQATEDLRDYTNIIDAIDAALHDSLVSGPRPNPRTERTPQGGRSPSPYAGAMKKLGGTHVDAVPIPLLVLGGLGSVLLLTAGGLGALKWLKATRVGRGTPPTAEP